MGEGVMWHNMQKSSKLAPLEFERISTPVLPCILKRVTSHVRRSHVTHYEKVVETRATKVRTHPHTSHTMHSEMSHVTREKESCHTLWRSEMRRPYSAWLTTEVCVKQSHASKVGNASNVRNVGGMMRTKKFTHLVLECTHICCSVTQCVAVRWNVLQCVAKWCSVLGGVPSAISCIVEWVMSQMRRSHVTHLKEWGNLTDGPNLCTHHLRRRSDFKYLDLQIYQFSW